MRPVELKLRNFRSYYGEEVSFDFRERRLVGIVGPIGSGKSTILDAVAFALYGRTSTVGRSTKALIHQRADSTAVALRFVVEGDIWEAQRMLRRKGASQHALYRLEEDADDAEKLEVITGETEVSTRVAELLGLDFDAFGRSMLLAQGRFAEFLTARPAERDKVLKGVFGHDRIDRMRSVAKERGRVAEIEAEKATVSVRHLAELEAATAARRENLEKDVARLEALEAVAPKIAEHTTAIETAAVERQSADEQLEALRSLAEVFPDDAEVAATLSAARTAAEQRAAAGTRLEEARKQQETAETRSASAAKTRSTLESATVLMASLAEQASATNEAESSLERARERLQQAVAESAGQTDRVSLAEAGAENTTAESAAVTEALALAETAHHDAMHADMAATLRRDLHEGERCPVCEQAVATIPAALGDTDVETAVVRLETARQARQEAEAANTKASAALEAAKTAQAESARRVAEAESGAADLEGRVDQAKGAAAATSTELAGLVGDENVDSAVAALREELESATKEFETAAAARDRAREDHDGTIAAEQAASKHLADLRVTLAGVAARLEDAREPGDDVESIADAAGTLRSMIEQTVRDTAKRRDQAIKLAEDHTKALEAIVADAEVTGSFDEALGELRTRVEVHREEVARAEKRLEGKAEQVALRDAHVQVMKTLQALAADLTDARFVRYLLDDERRRLAELGSEHFQLLTNGRYRFTEDGAFDIVDLTTADAVRKADSLSGGETFLASLGLALALAEIVARGGGRLDAFFLDEGFGTLDPEHLDLAMEGIETLVSESGNRLVVVVSHVPELRHRIEDLIELDRSPTTGDTRVLNP